MSYHNLIIEYGVDHNEWRDVISNLRQILGIKDISTAEEITKKIDEFINEDLKGIELWDIIKELIVAKYNIDRLKVLEVKYLEIGLWAEIGEELKGFYDSLRTKKGNKVISEELIKITEIDSEKINKAFHILDELAKIAPKFHEVSKNKQKIEDFINLLKKVGERPKDKEPEITANKKTHKSNKAIIAIIFVILIILLAYLFFTKTIH